MKTPNCCTSCGNAWEAEGSVPSFLTTVPTEPPAPGLLQRARGVSFGVKMQYASRFLRGWFPNELVAISCTFLDRAHVLVEHHWGAAFGRTPWGNPVQCSQALPSGPFAKPSRKQPQTARKRLQTGSDARKRTQTTRNRSKRAQTPAKECRQGINGRKRL